MNSITKTPRGQTTAPATLAVGFSDSKVDLVVTIPVALGRTVAENTPLVLGTTENAACSVNPTFTECAGASNNVLSYSVAYGCCRVRSVSGHMILVSSPTMIPLCNTHEHSHARTHAHTAVTRRSGPAPRPQPKSNPTPETPATPFRTTLRRSSASPWLPRFPSPRRPSTTATRTPTTRC